MGIPGNDSEPGEERDLTTSLESLVGLESASPANFACPPRRPRFELVGACSALPASSGVGGGRSARAAARASEAFLGVAFSSWRRWRVSFAAGPRDSEGSPQLLLTSAISSAQVVLSVAICTKAGKSASSGWGTCGGARLPPHPRFPRAALLARQFQETGRMRMEVRSSRCTYNPARHSIIVFAAGSARRLFQARRFRISGQATHIP